MPLFKWINAERLAAFFTAVIAITGVWALYFAHRELSQAHEEAQVQHLITYEKDFGQDPMLTYRREYAIKRLKGEKETLEGYSILDFFESVGLLTRRGLLDESDVWNEFGYAIPFYYADMKDIIEESQKEDSTYYENFVWLVNRLTAIEISRHRTTQLPSKDDIRDFWKDESQLLGGSPAKTGKRTRHN